MLAIRCIALRLLTACLMLAGFAAPSPSVAADPPITELITGIVFHQVPAGCFDMGDLEVGIIPNVCLETFWISQHEVTNAQFRLFRPSHDSGRWEGSSLNADDQPVVGITWYDAVAFADWLSQQSGKRIRLPSEAEWESAARGGTTTLRYWGTSAEEASRYANLRESQRPFHVDGHAVTAPVGSFVPNSLQLHDMLGNVSEWVVDGYRQGGTRYGEKLQNPLVAAEGPLRVRRGGSFDDPLRLVGASHRDFYMADLAIPQTGFRLVMEP